MRSLRITLYARQAMTLPLAYNELLQGLIYSCWKDNAPQVHDVGFNTGASSYRMFTFGPLRGKGSIDSKRRTYRVSGLVDFEVRSPIEELLDLAASHLASQENVRIGAYELALANLETHDRLLFPQRCVIRTLQPIVAKRNTDDGHTTYLSPQEPGWLDLLQVNAAGKAEALGISCDTTLEMLILAPEHLRKRVTRFKRIYVTGWMGEFILKCDPLLMQLLYSCGLGSRNSQGFGMFEIDSQPI